MRSSRRVASPVALGLLVTLGLAWPLRSSAGPAEPQATAPKQPKGLRLPAWVRGGEGTYGSAMTWKQRLAFARLMKMKSSTGQSYGTIFRSRSKLEMVGHWAREAWISRAREALGLTVMVGGSLTSMFGPWFLPADLGVKVILGAVGCFVAPFFMAAGQEILTSGTESWMASSIAKNTAVDSRAFVLKKALEDGALDADRKLRPLKAQLPLDASGTYSSELSYEARHGQKPVDLSHLKAYLK